MSEMVERVARAISRQMGCRALYTRSALICRADESCSCRDAARAAIEAMREPTDAMYEAVSNCGLMWRENTSTRVWQLMVDGAK